MTGVREGMLKGCREKGMNVWWVKGCRDGGGDKGSKRSRDLGEIEVGRRMDEQKGKGREGSYNRR